MTHRIPKPVYVPPPAPAPAKPWRFTDWAAI